MPRASPLSVPERASIDALVVAGRKVTQIAQFLGRSKSCISSYIQQKTYNRVRHKVGLKKVLLPRQRRRVIRSVSNRSTSVAKIKSDLNLPCSKSTILRTLQDCQHLQYKKIGAEPALTRVHIEHRRQWCSDRLGWRQE